MCEEKINANCFKVFFLGIGGISMSALASMLKDKGFCVFGWDRQENRLTDRLKEKGIPINQPFDIDECDIAVISSAVPDDDKIKKRLLDGKKAVVSRGWLLARIAECYPQCIGVAGTHGKTTCTCIIAHILACASMQFTLHVGGEDGKFGNSCCLGDDIFLTEVCEFKKNISHFAPDIGVLLNVDDDHEESYGSFDGLVEEFNDYIGRSKTAIVNLDDQSIDSRGAITFSFSDSRADYFASDISFDGKTLECAVNRHGEPLFKIKTQYLRRHDVYNILASTAVSVQLGVLPNDIKRGIEDFCGVKRRNEYLGDYCGKPVYADYAHHPSQIKTVVQEYQERFGKNVRFLFQSHTYSRTARLIDDFVAALSQAKEVMLFETYGAREKYDEDGSYKKLGYKSINATLCDENKGVDYAFDIDSAKVAAYVVLGAGDLYDRVKEFLTEDGDVKQ